MEKGRSPRHPLLNCVKHLMDFSLISTLNIFKHETILIISINTNCLILNTNF